MKKKRTAFICLSLVMTLLLPVSLTSCRPSSQSETDQSLVSLGAEPIVFAPYREVPVTLNPSIEAYHVAEDLRNIINKGQFEFSAEAQNLLVKNGFVVVSSPWREFFSIYEVNRYSSIPNLITTDAMMHNYHLYFSYLLRMLEKNTLRPELNSLTESMLVKSQKQYQELKRTDWENAAKRNVAFFTVAARLLNPDSKIPAYVRKEVEQELQLIAAHEETFIPSPVMNMKNSDNRPAAILNEDYTQYIPRGHYAKSDDLKTYFKTMMWYGRMTFRASSEDETKSAALITLLLSDQKDFDRWNRIYEPTNFFVGKSDDLDIIQYHRLLKNIYKNIPSLDQLTENADRWEALRAALEKMDPPALNSIPVYDADTQPNREQDMKGFRFMGQRFTPDASIFQRLIYREVLENSAEERRMLPNGLDIPAAMGSETAYSILKNMGETDYAKYQENMEYLRRDIASLDAGIWTQNLYWTWLYTLKPLTEPKGEGYPSFMQNQVWSGKQLETYLGSWTELKHDTILYAKQVYAEMGGGPEIEDSRGYVEPNPVVYGRLAALTRMTLDGLESRSMLSEGARNSLNRMEELALKLKVIAEKELANEPLTEKEYELIESFGGQLEHFWLEAMKDEGIDHPSAVNENPAALIADVATDPNGQVLEVGTGFINSIYAVVPVDGTLRIAKGAVYSYYEFPWPANDRLTDAKWKSMLENKNAPEPPLWTKVYTTSDEVLEPW
ncbi:MAG: DUF3160 domain-containing protein [Eubacteriales bacterium]|nr:DUF3160 domain-containing protein [Eubacteriales bacterium]